MSPGVDRYAHLQVLVESVFEVYFGSFPNRKIWRYKDCSHAHAFLRYIWSQKRVSRENWGRQNEPKFNRIKLFPFDIEKKKFQNKAWIKILISSHKCDILNMLISCFNNYIISLLLIEMVRSPFCHLLLYWWSHQVTTGLRTLLLGIYIWGLQLQTVKTSKLSDLSIIARKLKSADLSV